MEFSSKAFIIDAIGDKIGKIDKITTENVVYAIFVEFPGLEDSIGYTSLRKTVSYNLRYRTKMGELINPSKGVYIKI